MIITALNNKEEEVVLQAMKKEARGKCRMQMEGNFLSQCDVLLCDSVISLHIAILSSMNGTERNGRHPLSRLCPLSFAGLECNPISSNVNLTHICFICYISHLRHLSSSR